MPLFRAESSDLPAVADLVNSAYRGDSSRQGWATEADLLGGQRTDAEALKDDLDARPDARLLMLKDAPDGELLGCVWLEPYKQATWYMGMVTVRPDLQDRRLGRTLLDDAEAAARDLGARKLRMTVISLRDTLIAWYERRGYAVTGETAPFPYDNDRFGLPLRGDLSFVILEKAI